MKFARVVALAIILFLISAATVCAVGIKGSSGSSSSGSDDEQRQDQNDVRYNQSPNPGDNTYSNSEVIDFANKLITFEFPQIPEGNPIFVPLYHGEQGEVTWEKVNNNFGPKFFTGNADKARYDEENRRFRDNESTSFQEHMEVCKDLVAEAAKEAHLKKGARVVVPLLWMSVTNDYGTSYLMPAVGEISHNSRETGEIAVPGWDDDSLKVSPT